MRRVELPWPYKNLSPNSRAHWAVKSRATKQYRWACAALSVGVEKGNLLSIWFYPPDKRQRDMDNLVASFKAGQDGLADAMGIDDRNFVCSYGIGEPRKNGAVIVEVVKP